MEKRNQWGVFLPMIKKEFIHYADECKEKYMDSEYKMLKSSYFKALEIIKKILVAQYSETTTKVLLSRISFSPTRPKNPQFSSRKTGTRATRDRVGEQNFFENVI